MIPGTDSKSINQDVLKNGQIDFQNYEQKDNLGTNFILMVGGGCPCLWNGRRVVVVMKLVEAGCW